MIKFNKISQIEHGEYPFEDAVAGADCLNGDFGAVTAGVFAVAADGTKVIMQKEDGDDEGMPEYVIKKGEHVRVLDLGKINGQAVEVYGAQLPGTFAKDDQLESTADGKLATGAAGTPYLKVTEIIGNKLGVVATVVTE